MTEDAITGCLLGTAVGDALGLPYEGMSARRAARRFKDLGCHHFFFGRGMVSDDTEHALFTAEALIRGNCQPDVFQKELARSLRWWLLGLPAGIGLATLRSVVRLWVGIHPDRAGVFSAGNGPAMRSPLLGVVFQNEPERLKTFVQCATRITHSDPKAYYGACGAALAAAMSAAGTPVEPEQFAARLADMLDEAAAQEFIDLVGRAAASAGQGRSVAAFAQDIGSTRGVSGYIYHTVPCVLQTWFRFQDDYAAGIAEILAAGGDTDTAAAVLGGVIGARVGPGGIPDAWLAGIMEWPRTVAWMRRLGEALYACRSGSADEARVPGFFRLGLIPRNALFLATVLTHGFRRLLPPY
jgi:ADP-ribosylglycohydrolase